MRLATFGALLLLLTAAAAQAQDKELPLRQYSSPEEIITISGDTPFGKAMAIFGNAFKRFAQKPLVYDPVTVKGGKSSDDRQIGINIPNMYWRDAFDLVLRVNDYWYLESPDYVRLYPLHVAGGKDTSSMAASNAVNTNEVQISAVFFEANRSQLEELGIDWSFTNTAPNATTEIQSSNTGSSSSQSDAEAAAEYGLKTSLHVYKNAVDVLGMLKALQSENLAEVISAPSIVVRSGEPGRIQVGQDFSIKQRDFSGNTVEKFYSAGTIIEVTPTVLTHDSINFVHMKISAERSSVIPDPVSTIINKTVANTSIILLNGEETVVGGLYLNDAKTVRRGIPFLKDLPWWVFGLRYLFGYDKDEVAKKELIIILKANISPSIQERVATRLAEVQAGPQPTLQSEVERQEAARSELLRQIEAARAKR
jgi:type IV pilus assembly protein PilQ